MPPRRGTRIRTRTRTTLATATATTPMTDAAIRALIAQSVADALAKQEIQRYINLNGDGSQGFGSGITRPVSPTRECTYSDFLICHPLNFKGTEGVVGLTQWFERKETVFHISNCAVENQVKYLHSSWCLIFETWWNSHVQDSLVQCRLWHALENSYGDDNCQELALMCGRMFPGESDEVEKYVGGLPDMIQGSVMASKPKTMREAIEIANDLIDEKVRAYAKRQAENKRKFDNNNKAQQQPPKKQSVAMAYTARSGERKEYIETLPLCNKCKFHHNGPWTTKYVNYKKVGYLRRDCWNPTATSNQRTITGLVNYV
ncbi:hypothetical protein Tco_0976498 [Tanacetum coccineum]|uniref:Ty3 transposon capsid-like protein domain-containing protein n=1 Tax=Tanacetum coccineum TaxID=301880 RepID=A0ABQ5EHE3_9ASTR